MTQVEPMTLMDLPDDMLRHVFKTSQERNMLVVNKSLTKTISKESDIALIHRWLRNGNWTDAHDSEVQFRNMLRRGLDPNTNTLVYSQSGSGHYIVPLIIILTATFPLLAKILLRHPDLNRKTTYIVKSRTHYIPTVFFLSSFRNLYHEDIEYMLETFPDEIMKNTFKLINLTWLIQQMDFLSIDVIDNILRRGYISLKDIHQKIHELEASLLPGEPKGTPTYQYLHDVHLSLLYYRDLLSSKGGAKRRRPISK